MPISGLPLGKTSTRCCCRASTSIREEPGGADRLFVVDMNGPLYILDKKTRQFTKYLDFDGRDDRPGLFHRFYITSGYGNGINGFIFDPDYRRNGKFYTVHLEHHDMPVSNLPDNRNHPGLNVTGYTTTPTSTLPGATISEGVLIEWIDTNTKNATFEGTARELLRTRLNTHSHPTGRNHLQSERASRRSRLARAVRARSATARPASRGLSRSATTRSVSTTSSARSSASSRT